MSRKWMPFLSGVTIGIALRIIGIEFNLVDWKFYFGAVAFALIVELRVYLEGWYWKKHPELINTKS